MALTIVNLFDRERTQMTVNAVGVDVSNGHSTVAVLRPLGEVVALPFEVSHTPDGLNALAECLKGYAGETRVIMEHTGRYYESIANALLQGV